VTRLALAGLVLALPVSLIVAAPAVAAVGSETGEEARASALFEQGNRLYQAEDYVAARQAYEEILDLGLESASVYFNLGNAAIRSGEVGVAVWAYARARRLDPGDGDIRANLTYARALRKDAVPAASSSRLLDALAQITGRVRPGDALRAAVVLYWALALVLAVRLASGVRALRTVAMTLAVCLGLALLFAATKAVVAADGASAVVLPAAIDVASAPGEEGRTVFTLHAGAEVRVGRTLGGWVEISLGPELKGWIPEESLARI
jgi:tetratricopeptide (TPR) repeat protein